MEKKKSFWKDKKNIAIVILSFILFCCLCSSDTTMTEKNHTLSKQLEESNAQITTLQGQKKKLEEENHKLQENNTQTAELQASNQELQSEIVALEAQKNQLEQEKANLQAQNQELNVKIQELQSISDSNNTRTKSASTAPTTTVNSVPITDTNSEIVYITDTGKKYHKNGCSYLKKSKHEISKSSAQEQGYTACSRCNP